MQTSVFLTGFTRQGVESARDSPDRTRREWSSCSAGRGGSSSSPWDGTTASSSPTFPTTGSAQAALTLASSDNVTTETLRAFPLEAFREIVAAA